MDSYHYINHCTTDYLCRKYCNPAPLNGSAPNLVVVEFDIHGRPHFKRAFNTQVLYSIFFTQCISDFQIKACEHLNAWIGGFESMLSKMTAGNFNWFLHTMLCLHTQEIIEKQKAKEADNTNDNDDDNEDEA